MILLFTVDLLFDTVNYSVVLKKLEIYGIHGKNSEWFTSYLRNREQYIQIDDNYKTDFLSVTCGVPKSSILGPLLLLLYVNDLTHSSKILDPMFADNTDLVFSNCNIRVLLSTVNSELSEINQWFLANKLSLKWKSKTRVTSYEFKSTSCEFKSTSYEFRPTSYKLKSTNYELKSTSYEVKSTSY